MGLREAWSILFGKRVGGLLEGVELVDTPHMGHMRRDEDRYFQALQSLDVQDAEREARKRDALAFFERMLGDLASKVADEIGAMRSVDDESFTAVAKSAVDVRKQAYLATYAALGEDLANAAWRAKYGHESTPRVPTEIDL